MIAVNALTGISGAGHTPSEGTHFMNLAENAVPYDTGDIHRHVGEIEQFLEGRSIFFSPVKIPIKYGMLVNSNVALAGGVDPDEVREALHVAYDEEPFVHVLEEAKIPEIQDAVNTDERHIGIVAVGGNDMQIGTSLNNVRGGGATQGVHAFNIMMGYPETAGLTPKASMR
jgi:N-acetyl-gamma-glutamyl-phosphate reductase